MRHPVRIFAVVTLALLPLLAAGALAGGLWVAAALAYGTVFAFAMDELVAWAADPADPGAEFPAADALSVALALAHFALLALAVWAIAGRTGLSGIERAGAFAAMGLFFGQVSNSNAHELIHRARRPLHRLGMWVYISLLFGHHTSAHPRIHHRYVASARDPNSPPPGMGYYRFALRAWTGSFRAGLAAERAALDRIGRSRIHNPYILYLLGAVGFSALALALAGPAGLAAYVALAAYAQAQLLLSDYVQHYGLTRAEGPNGKLAPVGPEHSWNAPHWFTSALMLNAPRHSDHHAHPARPYPALQLDADMPMLPRSLPVMAALALIPPLWRRIMDPRAAAVRAAHIQAPAERP